MSISPGHPDEPPKQGIAKQTADDAKTTAKTVLASTATGAATAGLHGAAIGAAKGLATSAIKTKTGRGLIVLVTLAPLLVVILLASLIFGGDIAPSASHQTANAELAASVASAEIDNEKELEVLRTSAYRAGVRWEILASIKAHNDVRTIDKGTGPMGLDPEKVKDELTETQMLSIEDSSMYLARRLSQSSQDLHSLQNYELDAGYEGQDRRATDEEIADDEFTFKRVAVDTDEAKALRDEVRTKYTEALKPLPIVGNPEIAPEIFRVAHAWSVGEMASPQSQDSCLPADGDIVVGGQTSVDLNESQIKYAQAIINQVANKGMPQRAAIVALATALQESTLRMYWNIRVPGSEALTEDKEAKGSDGFSVGLFQQQVNGTMFSWGTVADAMSPSKSTDMFLDRLKTISGWESLPITVAAQRVQASAFPDHYAKWEGMSRQLVSDLKPTNGGYKDPHEGTGDEEEPGGHSEDGGHLKVNPAVKPDLQAVEAAIKDRFGRYVSSMGDYRVSADDHGDYRAVDLMIRDFKSDAGIKGGDEIAHFLITNAKALGVDYLIWRDRIWLGAQGWKPYSTGGYGGMYAGNWNDTTLHNDHVHVSVYGNKGTGGEYKYTSPDGTTSPCGGTIGIGSGSAGQGDDYPYKKPGIIGFPQADPWGMFVRECVSFVSWRLNQQMGWKEGQEYPFTAAKMGMAGDGNAEAWSRNLAKKGYITDKNPRPGAVAWWSANFKHPELTTGAAGHVAIVKSVNADGTVTVEQYNVIPYTFSEQTLPLSAISGFIHVADLKDTKKDESEDKK